MNQYEKPEVEIVTLEDEDVIVASRVDVSGGVSCDFECDCNGNEYVICMPDNN